MSSKDMKNYFKNLGLENPPGYWKMNKEQMMEEISKHEKLQMKEKKTSHGNSKVVEVTIKETGEKITFVGANKFHNWVKENHPQYGSWSILSSVLANKKSKTVEKFKEHAPFSCEYGIGFKYGR